MFSFQSLELLRSFYLVFVIVIVWGDPTFQGFDPQPDLYNGNSKSKVTGSQLRLRTLRWYTFDLGCDVQLPHLMVEQVFI